MGISLQVEAEQMPRLQYSAAAVVVLAQVELIIGAYQAELQIILAQVLAVALLPSAMVPMVFQAVEAEVVPLVAFQAAMEETD
jgi:hypothetical protein